jgi:hypothetical protein
MLVFGEDFLNGTSRNSGECRVRPMVVGKGYQPSGQSPTTTPSPSGIVHGECCAKHVASVGGKERPSDHHIACWVAHAETSEVNHSAQSALNNQKISGLQVTMKPNG